MQQLQQTKTACFCIIKNGESHVEEWIAYQLALGFDSVIIFDNLSTDRTKELVTQFSNHFDVRYFLWTETGPLYQHHAYQFGMMHFKNEFDWIAFLDADEFLVLPKDKKLNALVSLPKTISAIALPWCFFGSSGLKEKVNSLVIESFLYRSDVSFEQNKIIKTIARPKDVYKISGPHGFGVTGSYADMNGEKIQTTYLSLKHNPNFHYGKLHHYFVKTLSDWNDKLKRGNPNTLRTFDEFYLNDRNEIFDDSALVHKDKVLEILNLVRASQATMSVPPQDVSVLPTAYDRIRIFLYFKIRYKIMRHFINYKKFLSPQYILNLLKP